MLRKVGHALLLLILWVPILLSGLDNLREQFGYGVGNRWGSWSSILFGWGMWLIGCVVWYWIIGFIGRKFLGERRKTWDAMFPNAQPGDEPTPGMRKEANEDLCRICGMPTVWHNTVTDVRICSHDCRMKELQEIRSRQHHILQDTIRGIEEADRH